MFTMEQGRISVMDTESILFIKVRFMIARMIRKMDNGYTFIEMELAMRVIGMILGCLAMGRFPIHHVDTGRTVSLYSFWSLLKITLIP